MKSRSRPILVMIVVAILLIAANAAEIALVFKVTSNQTTRSGADRLEVIGGELEETINDAKLSTMRYAMEVQPLLDDRETCESFIRQKKAEMIESTGSVCFNVYLAAGDWYYIPDFQEPEGYEIEKRSWYLGAMKQQGEPYVTDPYVDAMTGNICFTVSVMLGDGRSIASMDYTMETIQQHIKQMNSEGKQNAVIVTEEGIIAGCSDEELVGKSLIQSIPDYAGIFSLVRNSDGSVSVNRRGESLFAARSGFGWYLIVSENNWSLYKTSYIEMLGMLIISLSIFGVVLSLYGVTARRARNAMELLDDEHRFLRGLAGDLREPVERIRSGASIENVRSSTDYELEFQSIREDAGRLSDMLTKLWSYSELSVRRDKAKARRKTRSREMTVSRHFRSIILGALLLVTSICIYINLSASLRYGAGQMQRSVSIYEYQLSEWINTQKSILDMFCSNISTDPDMLKDYDATISYLDRITKQYPEISVSYMTNPDFEHTVMMNNGWEPDDDWHVEERSWYKELMASEKNWTISSPYYDEQTGLYCVTFAEKVYDDRTGEFLGNFGIDFYMDKLVDILGSSYTGSGYAFLADAKGEVINHPYGKFQMSENGSVNIISLPYNAAEPNGENVKFIKDYDGRFKAVVASRNEASGFSVYVVDGIVKIYQGVFIYGTLCIIVLICCVVIVYKVMTSLIRLQDEANRKLKESADAAIAADKAKSSFLAQMSHEIRTPINAVLGMNEMVIHESRDERIREYAASIQSSGRTLLSLVNSILDFSKIEDGKMEIIPAEYETAVMINDLVTSIAPRAAAKKLELRVLADESLPLIMRGDDVRIKQVILNLLTNAVKYTERGSVTLILRGEEINDGEITIYTEVTDTGIGIREEDIGGLFESFRRLDEKRNRNIEGTGLGMSIVTRLLDMMGSKLEVKSVYGEGSSFSFRITQGIVNGEHMGSYEKRIAAESERERQGEYLYAPEARILVVDDNSMNLKVARNLLSIYGIAADTAGSGEEALGLISRNVYDIIFLDHMMPKMDGIEVMRRIRSEGLVPESTVVIALTANAIIGAREQYMAEGFDGYLTKPIESRVLEKELRRSLPESRKSYRIIEKPRQEPEPAGDGLSLEEIMRAAESCPGLNITAGLNNCMGSKEFWLDTLEGFAEADKSGELEKAWADRELDLYRITVHSIKSAAKTIGADTLSEQARQLELAAAKGDEDYISARHGELMSAYREMTANVKKLVSENKP